MTKIAVYRTRRSAERYAQVLRTAWPDHTVSVVPHGFDGFSILVKKPDGRSGLALRK